MNTKLYVGNLAFHTTEDTIQRLFSQCGEVAETKLILDRETGRSRGFAFVEMSSQAEADKAVSMFHQKEFQGRTLTVNEARPREERGGGGGDRNRGGGGYRDRR